MALVATSHPGRSFTPSPQQAEFLGALADGEGHVLLEARAGSGKSTTCREGAWSLPSGQRSVYCCFNTHVAQEFQRDLPGNCQAATMHSLGLRILKQALGDVQIDNDKIDRLAEPFFPERYQRPERRAVTRLANLCRDLLVEPEPTTLVELAAMYDVDLPRWGKDDILAVVPEVLTKCREQTGAIDFADMIWLPVVLELALPRPADVLFVDEAQDLNRCQQHLISRICPSGRVIVVGDRHQCQPAGTRVTLTGGKTKKIEDIVVGDEVVTFNRRGGAIVGRERNGRKVLEVASRRYCGPLIEVHAGDRRTLSTPEHRFVARFVERDARTLVTYLMRRGDRYRVGWCQLFNKNGNLHLAQRARIERADAAWILGVHDDRTSASVEESVLAATFGIPTIPFHPVAGANHLTEDAIGRVFAGLDLDLLAANAELCLDRFGREIDYPFWEAGARARRGRTTIFVTQACNLLDGLMAIPGYDGEVEPTWYPIKVTRTTFSGSGEVYSLRIDRDETYVADGLVTHNSIYGFRGADHQSIPRLHEGLARTPRGIESYPLTVTRRCPRLHVEMARKIVPDLDHLPTAPDGEILQIQPEKAVDVTGPGDMVLCRTNAPLVGLCYRFLQRGVRAFVRGRDIGKGLKTLVLRLKPTGVGDLVRKVHDYRATEGAKAAELRDPGPVLQQINDRADCLLTLCAGAATVDEVNSRIDAMFSDLTEDGAVLLSSIHKAKGLERETIVIVRPELLPGPWATRPEDLVQERNLAYVAATRSRSRLLFAGEIPQLLKV